MIKLYALYILDRSRPFLTLSMSLGEEWLEKIQSLGCANDSVLGSILVRIDLS